MYYKSYVNFLFPVSHHNFHTFVNKKKLHINNQYVKDVLIDYMYMRQLYYMLHYLRNK